MSHPYGIRLTCVYFEGLRADPDEIPSLECAHEDPSGEEEGLCNDLAGECWDSPERTDARCPEPSIGLGPHRRA